MSEAPIPTEFASKQWQDRIRDYEVQDTGKVTSAAASRSAKAGRAPASKAPLTALPKPAPPNTITEALICRLDGRHSNQRSNVLVQQLFDAVINHLQAGGRVRISDLGIMNVKS